MIECPLNGEVNVYLKRMEEYGEWKNALLGGMLLDDYMYMEFLYPEDEDEVVPHLSNTQKKEVGVIVSYKTPKERREKRGRITKRLDSRSRRKSVRNTRECPEIEGNEGMVYIASGQEEKILYRLGLVPLYMKFYENEAVIASCVKSEDEYRQHKNRILRIVKLLEEEEERRKTQVKLETHKYVRMSNELKRRASYTDTGFFYDESDTGRILETYIIHFEGLIFITRRECFRYYYNILLKKIDYAESMEPYNYEDEEEYFDDDDFDRNVEW